MSVALQLAQRLRDLRLERGWTQQQLADRAGLSLNAINSFERAERFPRADSLDAVLVALSVEPEVVPELLGFEDVGPAGAWPSAQRQLVLQRLGTLVEGKSTKFIEVLLDVGQQLAPHFDDR